MKILSTALTLALLTACAAQSHHDHSDHDHSDGAHATSDHPHIVIKMEGDKRCITSNGVPDHETGTWRPGAVVEAQDHKFCMDATPELTGTIANRVRISGITVTGIPQRTGTAEY